jgi:hypothetical protein
MHHSSARLGSWLRVRETLHISDGNPRWIEHPLGRQVDIVALPLLAVGPDVALYPLDLSLSDVDMIAQPAMPVSIIGFPYGLTAAGSMPIWKMGYIASEPEIDYEGQAVFLVDATTRPGMSGSPVILRLSSFRMRNGAAQLGGTVRTRFMGVYPGRIHDDAEIGRVWRSEVIREILGASAVTSATP